MLSWTGRVNGLVKIYKSLSKAIFIFIKIYGKKLWLKKTVCAQHMCYLYCVCVCVRPKFTTNNKSQIKIQKLVEIDNDDDDGIHSDDSKYCVSIRSLIELILEFSSILDYRHLKSISANWTVVVWKPFLCKQNSFYGALVCRVNWMW